MISVHMLVISVVEKCFRRRLNSFIPLKKSLFIEITVLIIYIAYSRLYIHRLTLNIYKLNIVMNRYLFCCRRINLFLRKALIFVATCHYQTH